MGLEQRFRNSTIFSNIVLREHAAVIPLMCLTRASILSYYMHEKEDCFYKAIVTSNVNATADLKLISYQMSKSDKGRLSHVIEGRENNNGIYTMPLGKKTYKAGYLYLEDRYTRVLGYAGIKKEDFTTWITSSESSGIRYLPLLLKVDVYLADEMFLPEHSSARSVFFDAITRLVANLRATLTVRTLNSSSVFQTTTIGISTIEATIKESLSKYLESTPEPLLHSMIFNGGSQMTPENLKINKSQPHLNVIGLSDNTIVQLFEPVTNLIVEKFKGGEEEF